MIYRYNGTFETTLERADIAIEVSVKYSGYSDPGRCSGPPEMCYPPEGDMELLSVLDLQTGLPVELTSDEEEKLIDEAMQQSCDDGY